jgi:hypothetical protein
MKKLFAEEIFIINYFNNINNDFNDFGTYQFKSSVDDWKKLIFFFILIKKHYTKI